MANNFYLALESSKRDNTEKLVYNARTGSYEKVYSQSAALPSTPTQSEKVIEEQEVPKSAIPATPSNTKTGNVSQTDTKAKADKKFIDTESNTVTADIDVIPTDFTMGIKLNDTVNVIGVGNNFSGPHLITSITKSINASNGITISFSTKRTGFGETKASKEQKQNSIAQTSATAVATSTVSRPKEVDVSKNNTSKKFNVGDKVTVSNAAPQWKVNYYIATGNSIEAEQLAPHRVYTVGSVENDGKVTLKETGVTFLTIFVKKVQ